MLTVTEKAKFAEVIVVAGELWSELPEEMVEKIVSMIPYPYILNVHKLGKDWKSKLEDKRFREMVKSTSINWPIYFPLFLEKSKRVLTGLDRRSGTWVKICLESVDLKHPSVVDTDGPRTLGSALPCRASWELAGCITGMGSLICVMTEDPKMRFTGFGGVYLRCKGHPKNNIFVFNVITRDSKLLPQRPLAGYRYYEFPGLLMSASYKPIYMLPDGPENYKVLYVVQARCLGPSEFRKGQVCTNLYESRSNSWTVKLSFLKPWDSRETSVIMDTSGGVYLNGIVYFTSRTCSGRLLEVWAYDVETGGWHRILGPLPIMVPREFASAQRKSTGPVGPSESFA